MSNSNADGFIILYERDEDDLCREVEERQRLTGANVIIRGCFDAYFYAVLFEERASDDREPLRVQSAVARGEDED
jgi:hypothetical protein